MIYQLDDEIWFPDPHKGEDDGLFAIGGDLSIDRLLLAYSNGIFPWYAFRKEDNDGMPEDFFDENGEPYIRWYCPMERFVIFPKEIHISHSMRQMIRRGDYMVTMGEAFERVIRHCSDLRIDMEGAWLGEHIIKAYTELHNQGFAQSVEVWNREGELIGGLYGVVIGKAFIGESMFSLAPNGSKLALIHLAQYMAENNCTIIDCQLETPHLKSMGGRYISYDEYRDIIHNS